MTPRLVRLVVSSLTLFCYATIAVTAQGVGDDTAVATVHPATDAAIAPADIHDDMRTVLRKVGNVPCSESVRSRTYKLLFENNKALHDKCFSDCKYQFFPATQEKATPAQIAATVTSKACVRLFSGVILAKFSECDIDFVSTRSQAESVMRMKADIDDGRGVPTQEQFYQFYNLNRVINLLNENASLIEDAFRETATHITLWEMTKMMNPIYVDPNIQLTDDMTILVRDDDDAFAPFTAKPVSAAVVTNSTVVVLTSSSGSSAGSVGPSDASSSSTSSSSSTPTALQPAETPVIPTSTPAPIKETQPSNEASSRPVWSSTVVGAVALVYITRW